MKFSEYVWKGKSKILYNFGIDPDHDLDLLDQWNVIFKADNSKTYGRISMKFSGNVWNGKRKKWFNFGSDPDHYLDLLDPSNVIFKDITQKLTDRFRWNFQNMSEMVKGRNFQFWEWSGSLSGSSGSKDGFRWNFQDMSEQVKGRNDSIFRVIWITIWIFWIHEM